LDLFDELEGYEESSQTKDQQQKTQKAYAEGGVRKDIMAKDPKIRGSPRRLNLIAAILVGKSYPELKHLLPSLRNTGDFFDILFL
jgi:hypothetical protein